MNWSWRIGQVAGIGVYIHGTFLILLGWVGISHLMQGHSAAMAVNGLLFILSLFGIVVLHELGHALMAKRFGIKTKDITLYPIGGVARLERMPKDPKQELLVALAGPAVNVVLAMLLFFVVLMVSGFDAVYHVALVGGQFLAKLMWVNVTMAVFNLLPAFPMDGGRVLRAFLAIRMDYVQATQIAASVGKVMALLFGLVGLFFNPFLVFIALFVWIGGSQEAVMVQMNSVLEGVTVDKVMIRHFETLSPTELVQAAIEHILAGFQQDFPVVESGKVVGILTRADLLTAVAQRGENIPISEVMQSEFETASPSDLLPGVLVRLAAHDCHTLPVMQNGLLVGVVTTDNLGEFLMVQNALHTTHRNSTDLLH